MTSSEPGASVNGARQVPACSIGKGSHNVTASTVKMTSHVRGGSNLVQLDSLTRGVKCTLDEEQCLSLQDILSSFQTAINEEQAWALCYETVKCFGQHYQASQAYLITDPSHLAIHKDGFVHPKSLLPSSSKANVQGRLLLRSLLICQTPA